MFLARTNRVEQNKEKIDTESEIEIVDEAPSDISPASSKRRKNNKGLVVLDNGVVAMRNLELASRVPTKTRDDDTPKLFSSSLTLSKAFTLFTFIVHGNKLPIEKIRDDSHRQILLHSASPYCLSQETLATVLAADPDEKNAYLIGLAKNAQQVIRYTLYGIVGNYMNERVFTPRDVYPAEDVKLHLGLTGDNARKCFMEL